MIRTAVLALLLSTTSALAAGSGSGSTVLPGDSTVSPGTLTIHGDTRTPVECPGAFHVERDGTLICDNWHLLTQTEGGQMQLTKNLSQHECEFMRARALGEPATDAEKMAEAEKNTATTAKRVILEKLASDTCKTKDSDGVYNQKGNKISPGSLASPLGNTFECKDHFVITNAGTMGIVRMGSPNDIKSAECFQ